MVPIIRYLLQFQCQILVAATGRQKKLLETEFPQLNFLKPPEYDVRYNGKTKGLTFGLLRQIPRLIRVIRNEKAWVEQIVSQYNIDTIISDNRYGFRSNIVPSVIITHQVSPKSGISSAIDHIVKNIHIMNTINIYPITQSPHLPQQKTKTLTAHMERINMIL